MGSLVAESVAREVLQNIIKGKRPSVSKIAISHGYSPTSANSNKVQKTQSFKNVIAPVVKRWEKERERITTELEGKDLTQEKYATLVGSIDILTKNIQLLSGRSTESIAVKPIYGGNSLEDKSI